jgi:hypothetical protein
MTRFYLSISIFFISFISVVAQPAVELKKYQDAYPGLPAVALEENIEMHFEINEGELLIYEDKYIETFYLQDLAGFWSEEEIPYSTFSEIENLEAHSKVPQGKKYKTYKVKEIKEKDELSSAIFHDDLKSKTFSYEGLRKGAKSVLKYRTIYKEEHLIGKEYLQSYLPIICFIIYRSRAS